ncbi:MULTISPECIES: aspartate/glutamate racemase family protein [unclassified Nocardia]|uniref:aspartate/glutamate racemase family protein n=1 Tax=unclassified Nocardia TaxID=2637762 RepID=UPI001CE3E740|nr:MULTISPECIES: amino acid racemase [unclassified Nocardia]
MDRHRTMRHVGILAHSVEGASLCLRTLAQEGARDLGAHEHADVTLDCIAMGRSMPAWEAGEYGVIRKILATSADRLARAGAEFFVCPDNTAHMALESDGEDLALPGLHIAEIVAEKAAAQGYRRVGVLGTKYTMTGPIYPRVLAAKGIDAEIPDPDERRLIDDIIFGELCEGVFTDESRQRYLEIINRLRGIGCDAVALVCTEIPLLVTPDVSPLPTLDSTRLLAAAAHQVAIGARPLPTWYGGAVG